MAKVTFPVGLQLTPGLYRRVLTKLDEKVLPFMSSPLVLADFLTQSYNIGMLCLWYGTNFLHSPTTLACFVFGLALISYTVLQHWYSLSLKCPCSTQSYNIGMLCLWYGTHFLHSPTTLVCFVFTGDVLHIQHWYSLSLLPVFYTVLHH